MRHQVLFSSDRTVGDMKRGWKTENYEFNMSIMGSPA